MARLESRSPLSFLGMHGMHHSWTFRVASNGLVERSNGTLVAGLCKIYAPEQDQWPMKLDEAAFAVNAMRKASTAFSPFELVFSFVPRLPHQHHCPLNTESLTKFLLSVLDMRTEALANSEVAQEVCKGYDESHHMKSFKIGNYVWLRLQPVTTKLTLRFSGI